MAPSVSTTTPLVQPVEIQSGTIALSKPLPEPPPVSRRPQLQHADEVTIEISTGDLPALRACLRSCRAPISKIIFVEGPDRAEAAFVSAENSVALQEAVLSGVLSYPLFLKVKGSPSFAVYAELGGSFLKPPTEKNADHQNQFVSYFVSQSGKVRVVTVADGRESPPTPLFSPKIEVQFLDIATEFPITILQDLSLIRASTPDASWWFMRGSGKNQLTNLVRGVPQSVAAAFGVAEVCNPQGEGSVGFILGRSPLRSFSRPLPPIFHRLRGYYPHPSDESLLLPVGYKLTPHVRINTLRGLIGSQKGRLVLVSNTTRGSIAVEHVDTSRFEPLLSRVDYTVPETRTLTPKRFRSPFIFALTAIDDVPETHADPKPERTSPLDQSPTVNRPSPPATRQPRMSQPLRVAPTTVNFFNRPITGADRDFLTTKIRKLEEVAAKDLENNSPTPWKALRDAYEQAGRKVDALKSECVRLVKAGVPYDEKVRSIHAIKERLALGDNVAPACILTTWFESLANADICGSDILGLARSYERTRDRLGWRQDPHALGIPDRVALLGTAGEIAELKAALNEMIGLNLQLAHRDDVFLLQPPGRSERIDRRMLGNGMHLQSYSLIGSAAACYASGLIDEGNNLLGRSKSLLVSNIDDSYDSMGWQVCIAIHNRVQRKFSPDSTLTVEARSPLSKHVEYRCDKMIQSSSFLGDTLGLSCTGGFEDPPELKKGAAENEFSFLADYKLSFDLRLDRFSQKLLTRSCHVPAAAVHELILQVTAFEKDLRISSATRSHALEVAKSLLRTQLRWPHEQCNEPIAHYLSKICRCIPAEDRVRFVALVVSDLLDRCAKPHHLGVNQTFLRKCCDEIGSVMDDLDAAHAKISKWFRAARGSLLALASLTGSSKIDPESAFDKFVSNSSMQNFNTRDAEPMYLLMRTALRLLRGAPRGTVIARCTHLQKLLFHTASPDSIREPLALDLPSWALFNDGLQALLGNPWTEKPPKWATDWYWSVRHAVNADVDYALKRWM